MSYVMVAAGANRNSSSFYTPLRALSIVARRYLIFLKPSLFFPFTPAHGTCSIVLDDEEAGVGFSCILLQALFSYLHLFWD